MATLWLLSVIVFAAGFLLPGDLARAVLGPTADPRSVELLNKQLGLDRPIVTQYFDWARHALTGDLGTSLAYRTPVAPMVWASLANSLKLGAVAFLLVIPLSVLGGIVAALHAGKFIDKAITIGGVITMALPEFVSGIILILVFGIWFPIFPISAQAPQGSGFLIQVYYLLLPSVPLILILFGYIARMTRSGMVEALASDYTRTAVLKGLPRRIVVWRHVVRNALLPTIAVIFTQAGYMIGGLVVVETLFHYRGIGSLIFAAAKAKDFPLLTAGVVVVGLTYVISTLIGDAISWSLNPRMRTGGRW